MKAIKRQELFGYWSVPRSLRYILGMRRRNSWICEITGFHYKYKYSRAFLRYDIDFTDSNSTGSRGIFAIYTLETEKVYEIKSQVSWKGILQYFAIVTDDGYIEEISKEEVDEWLKNRPDLTYSIPPGEE